MSKSEIPIFKQFEISKLIIGIPVCRFIRRKEDRQVFGLCFLLFGSYQQHRAAFCYAGTLVYKNRFIFLVAVLTNSSFWSLTS